MKKPVFILFIPMLIILILVAGCAVNSNESDGTVTNNNLIKVGFTQTGAESVWRVANTESIKKAICEDNGFELIYADGQQKQENQIRAIRNFIQQDVDYIVLAPLVETGWDSVLEESKNAGIPVIIVDRMVNVKDDGFYTAYVGTDFYQEGLKAVDWLDSMLNLYKRDDETIHIVDIQGTIDSTAQLGRTKALEEAVDNHINWKLTAQECGDFTKPKAYEVMNNILAETHDIDVVYCENDSEAFGAIEALQEAGLSCGIKDGVIVISFDATSEGLTDCLSGLISLDVECNPLQGGTVADIIKKLNNGESVDKISYLEDTWFDCFTITQEIINSRIY